MSNMLTLKPNYFLAESVSDLPDYPGRATTVFLDIETKNNTAATLGKLAGLNPWKGDQIAGFAVTVDDDPRIFYVPMRHHGSIWAKNLPLEPVYQWVRDLLNSCKRWVNHNVVFDATFWGVEGVQFGCELFCTLTHAKVLESDRLKYGLDVLADEWCGMRGTVDERVEQWLKQNKTKDYSAVPPDLMGEYACYDVDRNRNLYHHIVKNTDASLSRITEMEMKLSPVLYDMAMDGLRIDRGQTQIEQFKALQKMIVTAEQLEKVAGHEWTNSNECVYDILCNKYKLPVLLTIKKKVDGREVDTGRPTFDKNALALYGAHPLVRANPEIAEVVKTLAIYRKESQFKSLFADNFLTLADDTDHIHPVYNAVVRTGRMSCSKPNIQQQNKRSKALILPEEGYGFSSNDFSQIEFRLIVHYIQDVHAIAAYAKDPMTDFHQWVADFTHMKRRPAKTCNFAIGYGAGKGKVVKQLQANPDIIDEISARVATMEGDKKQLFDQLVFEHATFCYEKYHESLPGIRRTSREAMDICKRRGYVKTAYGRRRHLPMRASNKAFNTVCQGTAMDHIKDRMIALSPRYNPRSAELRIKIRANVHDEILFSLPNETLQDPSVHQYLVETLETTSVPFSVPLKVGLGVSSKSWADAAE